MKRNKKGDLRDLLYFGIVMFVLSIIFIMAGKLNTDFNEDMQNQSLSNASKQISADASSRYSTVFDWIFFTVFIFAGLAFMVVLFLLDSNPVLFFAVLILFVFVLIVIAIMSNAYDEFSDNSDISDEVDNLPVLNWLLNNYVLAMLVMGFLGIVVLFAKFRMGT